MGQKCLIPVMGPTLNESRADGETYAECLHSIVYVL